MQFQVDPIIQTRENDRKPYGSFKKGQNAYTRRTKKILKTRPDFSRTCGFRREFTERLNFQINPSKVPNQWLDFCQNPLKVKKGPFLARFRDYWMIRIFPGKTAVYVSSPYGREHSCKKSEKSLERFSRNICHGLPTTTNLELEPYPLLT